MKHNHDIKDCPNLEVKKMNNWKLPDGYGPHKPWPIYPDPKAESLQPKWWHKLLFWKKWSYQEWNIRREYKSLKEMVDL